MRHVPTALYIDTEVFCRNNLRFDTKSFKELRATFVKGGLRLLVPAMMERELVRKFQERAKEVAQGLTAAHRKHPIEALDLRLLPSEQELEKQCFEKLYKNWEIFKEHFTVEPLPLAGRMEDIAGWYFDVEAPFSEGKKSKEFPDAFIISVLEKYHRDHSVRIAVISADGDFKNACVRRHYLSHFREIENYIDAFKPEFTKTDDGEIIDPTKPITTEDLTEMKAILGRGEEATEIECKRVLNLLSTRGSNYDYFFCNADKSFWIDSLLSSGHFNNPPAAERFDDGRVQMPIWWPIEYLVRVFEQAPEKVIEVLDSLPGTDNFRILEGILRIVLKSDDPELIQKFYGSIEAYLDSARWGYEKIIELLAKPYLFQGQLADISPALLLKIVEFQPDPMAEEKARRRREDANAWGTRLEPSPRFNAWEYQQILEHGVQPLSRREPVAVARILIDATASMIRLMMHKDASDECGDEDISEAWCPYLDQSQREVEGPEAILVHALAYACNAVYGDAPESIDALDQTLRNQRWKVFKCLRQLLCAQHLSDRTLPWIREFILAHEDFDKWDHHYEFQMMIRKACEHFSNRLLTEEERSAIFDKIISGPSQESFREWMGEGYTDASWAQRKHYFHRKQLRPFVSVFFREYRTYFNELEAEFPDDKLTDESYSRYGKTQSGWISHRSPYSTEDLKQCGDEELLDRINKWEEAHRDSDDWLVEIDIEALATAFQSVFKDVIVHDPVRLEFWFGNRERIERPVYVEAMVAVMQAITKEGQLDHMEQWLGFCDWILERPNEPHVEEDRRSDESRTAPDWSRCRWAVVEFVGVCLKDVHMPFTARDALANLLQKLCTQFDHRLDHDRPVLLNRNDQVTEAINNTRSQALEVLVNFGYWVRRHEEDADVRQLRKIMETRFAEDAACPLTLPEHAILGLCFVRIWQLNNEWAAKNKGHFFPRNDLKVWVEAFRAFIRFTHPFLNIFELLKDNFIFAIDHLDDFSLSKDSESVDLIDNLGQHLFSYYIWGAYPLCGDDSLLSAFYEKTANNRRHWSQLFDHIGRNLRNSGPELDEKIRVRILAFFDWRLEQAEPVELQAFTFWLQADCLDPGWRLDAYFKILNITGPKDVHLFQDFDSLHDLLENHTAEVVKCFVKITDYFGPENTPYIRADKAKPILCAGLNSADGNVRSNAERARENLLNAGYFDFVDMDE